MSSKSRGHFRFIDTAPVIPSLRGMPGIVKNIYEDNRYEIHTPSSISTHHGVGVFVTSVRNLIKISEEEYDQLMLAYELQH